MPKVFKKSTVTAALWEGACKHQFRNTDESLIACSYSKTLESQTDKYTLDWF